MDRMTRLKIIAGILLILVSFAIFVVKSIGSGAGDNFIVTESPSSSYQDIGGSTASSIREELSEEPEQIASPKALKMLVIDVSGAVNHPSVVMIVDGSRVYEAVEMAGGLSPKAESRAINLAAPLVDGQKLYIPTIEEVSSNSSTWNANLYNTSSSTPDTKDAMVNINSADTTTLQKLTGIGPKTAEKIIQYRLENGLFQNPEELMNVSGIGQKTFSKFKDRITISE